ncbi:uncharacterized protein LOC129304997 [Prosopis cineraria]|uniref:uncharacterized protein LOC129304997 n=1 Tax=Prosopis cineraria TaxID=364024 RepID=UPI0024101D67|nr:uncharacterized protein LOC129304997 [Prosopis cineraria]
MKQKVTLKVQMERETCRNKAFKIVSVVKGVSSVSMNDKDQLVVTGEDVDTVCLGKLLRKKFSSVTVLTVEEVKPKAPEEKKKKEEKDKDKLKTCSISIVPLNPCSSRHSSNCHGGDCQPCPQILPNPNLNCHGTCKSCSNCENLKRHGNCKPCTRCGSPKCLGSCKPCFRCESFKCHGSCKPCFRCRSYKCDGGCTSSLCLRPPCTGQCPSWIPCSSCCFKNPPPTDLCDECYIYIYLLVIVVIVISVFAKTCC